MKNILIFFSLALGTFVFSSIALDSQLRTGIVAQIQELQAGQGVTNNTNQQASAFFVPTASVETLKEKYRIATTQAEKKIRLLIMPGHEPKSGGAEYRNLKEREMAVELTGYLTDFIQNNHQYETIVPRSNTGWSKTFDTYFSEHMGGIKAFVSKQKAAMSTHVQSGTIKKPVTEVYHADAATEAALRIYGINKWSNENNIDVAIHIHFNDYPRSKQKLPGKYTGFTMYIPDHQYSNSSTSRAIAESIKGRMSHYYATSTFEQESSGIVEDQELIAIGAENSIDAPSILIEYGYMYQTEFQDATSRSVILKDMAYQTYLGIQDFFAGNKTGVSSVQDSSLFPYTWTRTISKKTKETPETIRDLLALQTVFVKEGLFPTDACPRTGGFGPCTTKALAQFQKKYGIQGEDGVVGVQTQKKLNSMYSVESI
ncbi:MAG: putative peptidoglycan binding domain [Candidatus Parcubacteria bacterium]